jgi:hypothetical protein
MAFAEDFAVYFTDFAQAVTVGGVSTHGIFDNASLAALGLVAGTNPVLVVKTASVPAVAQGDAVVIGATSYTVSGIKPDGTGITTLELEAV